MTEQPVANSIQTNLAGICNLDHRKANLASLYFYYISVYLACLKRNYCRNRKIETTIYLETKSAAYKNWGGQQQSIGKLKFCLVKTVYYDLILLKSLQFLPRQSHPKMLDTTSECFFYWEWLTVSYGEWYCKFNKWKSKYFISAFNINEPRPWKFQRTYAMLHQQT